MHDENRSVNVWPGYVAAISCLVLSLLLLASIVVVMITQLGLYAKRYHETLVQKVIAQTQRQAQSAASRQQSISVDSPVVSTSTPKPQRQLRLIFASDLIDIPQQQLASVADSFHQLESTAMPDWQIWAYVNPSDAVAKHNAFRLMVAVRTFMVNQGIANTRIKLQLLSGSEPVDRVKSGEIAIYIAPLSFEGVRP